MGQGKSSCSNSHNNDAAGSQDSRRHVCILYNGSDPTQKKNAKAFRDALRGGDGGKNFKVDNFIDVNHQEFDGVSWLRSIQNVLVLCIDQNGAESLRKLIDKREITAGGMPRVLSVSFGTTRSRSIMGEILERPEHLDQKDFCFGFQDVSELTTNDFDDSTVMREVKTSIMSA